ncbi:LiaF transmembrane domain-containing protein [Sphingobacterium sp. Mn56C]|uniref:LiaF transmembrane domain-containing protein n=1 Tax=Sphingobacterium sp. Mn56C TaxID=3395261 RepID=UPI003BDBE3AA
MKSKIATGIWFISFGIIALLHNFDVIDFNFSVLLTYWPLLIISMGVNFIFQNRKNGLYITGVINIVLCLFIIIKGLTTEDRFNFKNVIQMRIAEDTTNAASFVNKPYSSPIKEASLTINMGGTAFVLDSVATDQLLEGHSYSPGLGLKLESKGDSISPQLELSGITKNNNDKKSKVLLSLNRNPLWALTMNMGAISFNGDLSKHKFNKLEINAGAASINLKLGMPQAALSTIEINSAASSCVIAIPKDAACQIETDMILSSKNLEGFNKKDKIQQTANYHTASQKYLIKIDGAANSFKINRY